MSVICDCGAVLSSDIDVFRCAADGHQSELLAQAQEALDSTPPDQRDDAYYEALADLERFREGTTNGEEPLSGRQVIDLIIELENLAGAIQVATGFRPMHLVVGSEVAARMRSIVRTYPQVFGRRPHSRPASFPPRECWIGSLADLEVYEVPDAS